MDISKGEPIVCRAIGVIRTPFAKVDDMPIQPSGARGVRGRIELSPDLTEGLKDVDGFSHLILVYHFHRSEGFSMIVTPFLDRTPRGLFSTRAPRRPNPIGLSVVRLERIEGPVLHILDVDILDGTPLLDIKPYVAEFDAPADSRSGWIAKSNKSSSDTRSDDRFK